MSFSQESLLLRSCVFTLGQTHIPPLYALLSLCMDVVVNCGHWCCGNVAFCCSTWHSSAVAGIPVRASAHQHQREHGCSCGHWSVTQLWCWDKGSRRAKVGLSAGRVMAMQLEVAGIVYGAGTVQTGRNREVGAIRMRVCHPSWEGTFSSVGSGWPLSCCRSHSTPSGLTATRQPVSSLPGQGPREAFWRKGKDVIVWKTWLCCMRAFGPQRSDLAGRSTEGCSPLTLPMQRHLLSHDQHFCAGMGVDLGSESALPECLLMPVGRTAVSSLPSHSHS